MLPKSERLTKNDFVSIRPQVLFRGIYIDVAGLPATSTKFACVISKKRVKLAVNRNKIRRRVFSILEKVKPERKMKVIIYPKQNLVMSSHENLKSEIIKAFATI